MLEATKAIEPNTNSYRVELDHFQGPLDLLLSLIERDELDITRISLARVTDQYLAYLDIIKEINPDDMADFLVVAAKLVLIKSQVLLPRPPASLIEADEEDVGDELARQLLLYKRFKEMAAQFREIEEREERCFVRVMPPMPKIEPKLMPGGLTLVELLEAARQALAIKPPDQDVDQVVSPEVVTIGQQMVRIRYELRHKQQVSLRQLFGEKRSRLEIIVTLLALLELIKRRMIKVEQPDLFGDILIHKNHSAPELTEAEWAELTSLTEVS